MENKWYAIEHLTLKWDADKMQSEGVKTVIKMINDDGGEIDTGGEDLEEALSRMAERTEYTQRHQVMTQDIFHKWARVSCKYDGWTELSEDVDRLMGWLTENESQFPNYRTHMDQWGQLRKLALERSYIRQFIQRCTGNPDICNDASSCFNLEHLSGDYYFSSAEKGREPGLCEVFLKDKRAL